jgi:hypothetical protein
MDKVKSLIEKKGYINMSDFQMINFEIEMDRKISYKNKNITLSPLTPNSIGEYENQMKRIHDGELHMWNDTKQNNSLIGDFFGYVINPKKRNVGGYIYIYKILKKLESHHALKHWKCREKHVLILNNECLYEGPVKNMFYCLKYSDNYKIQGTTKVSLLNQELLQKYFETIF